MRNTAFCNCPFTFQASVPYSGLTLMLVRISHQYMRLYEYCLTFFAFQNRRLKSLGACGGAERRGGPSEAKQGMEAGIYDIVDA